MSETLVAVVRSSTAASAEPLRSVAERLAVIIDGIERFITSRSGPDPYPFAALQALRNELLATYLDATAVSRNISNLQAVLAADPAGNTVDTRSEIELGVALSEHTVSRDTELLIDLESQGEASARRGMLAVVVARCLEFAAVSARLQPGSAISVRLREEDGRLVVSIADNGAGFTTPLEWSSELASLLGIEPDAVSVALPDPDSAGKSGGTAVEIWLSRVVG